MTLKPKTASSSEAFNPLFSTRFIYWIYKIQGIDNDFEIEAKYHRIKVRLHATICRADFARVMHVITCRRQLKVAL